MITQVIRELYGVGTNKVIGYEVVLNNKVTKVTRFRFLTLMGN